MDQPEAAAPRQVTTLLNRLSAGDLEAEESLLQCVYLELHRIASRTMRQERPNHTLQPTALVHEAYMRLCADQAPVWQNRAHFYAVAARVMRRILTDHARRRLAEKRGGTEQMQVELTDGIPHSTTDIEEVLQVDSLLQRLALISSREAQVVEMRFFVGMTDDEIASVLGVSRRTVMRDWLKARAWMFDQLNPLSS